MSIFNHFKDLNLSQGQETALNKLEAFLASPTQVFMLKGYAGSGKTTILKGLVDYLNFQRKEFEVMAPTGRAAKILRDKTGYGTTIHKGIYTLSSFVNINTDAEDEAEQSFHYCFPIKKSEVNEKIIIIDESSMIASTESKHELFTFGSNVLLNDLLTYASLQTSKSKIIFVGDPAQLLPFGDNKSLALDRNYFTKLGFLVNEIEMVEVLRQGNNLILENAKTLRNLLTIESRAELKFQFDNESFIKMDGVYLIEKFVDYFPIPEIGNGVIISFSNAQCFHYNFAIREKLFPKQKEVNCGDLLLIINNNYHTYGADILNGEIVKVVFVDSEITTQFTPVYCDVNGDRVKRIIKIDFRKVVIRIPGCQDEISCYIIDSLLNSIDRDLSISEMKALYVNFIIRFNEAQKKQKEAGSTSFKVGSEEFKQALKNDPFFNALRVKYGYAITCHKAQGGEWSSVFVDYCGRVSLKDDPLRWCYTATTRGINKVFAINTPQFGKMDKFKFNEIGNIGSLPNEALALESVQISPFHNAHQHRCKSLKYWEISEKLESTDYKIIKVESLGDYQERYFIHRDGLEFRLDGYHKLSGHFIYPFNVIDNVEVIIKTEIESIFNSEYNYFLQIKYVPEYEFLGDLYSMMQAECNDLNISVTNVVKGKNSYVNYYLKTDSPCSYIQFYYNAKGQLTTAIPKSFNCNNDKKLYQLMQKLLSHAS